MTDEITLDNQWREVVRLTNDLLIERHSDQEMHSKYMMLLNDLRHDKCMGDKIVLGMYRAPASKDRHHNVEGGLTLHLLQMYNAWEILREGIVRRKGELHPCFTEANVWRAILHHDLNKVWRYEFIQHNPWKVDYYELDRPAELLGAMSKSQWIIQSYGIRLSLPLANALICAEGGYSHTRPRAETVFAKVLYLCDELSANVIDRLDTDRFWDSKDGGLNVSV